MKNHRLLQIHHFPSVCMAGLLCLCLAGGCSNAPVNPSSAASNSDEEISDLESSDKNDAGKDAEKETGEESLLDETLESENSSEENLTENVSDNASENASDNASAEEASDDQTLLTQFLDRLKDKDYQIQTAPVEPELGMNESLIVQKYICNGDNQYTVWEFYTDMDAYHNFNYAEVIEVKDLQNKIARNGNQITVTDHEDGQKRFYLLNENLIIQTDDPEIGTLFQQ